MKQLLAGRRIAWVLAVAATAAAVAFVDGGEEDIAAPAAGRPVGRSGSRAAAADGVPPPLRLEMLKRRDFGEMATDLMAAKSWYVPPPSVPAKPTAPPLPFAVTGRLIEPSGTTVFLSRQDRNQIVRKGDILDKAWRVDDITATGIAFTYLPLNETKTLALGAAP